MDTAAQHGHPCQHQRQRPGASGGGGVATNAPGNAPEKGRVGGVKRRTRRSMPRPVSAPGAPAAVGASTATPAAAVTRRQQGGGLGGLAVEGSASLSDRGSWSWLPEPLSPEAAALTTAPSSSSSSLMVGERGGRRPAVLLEERSVFAGRPGRVAGECAPAAARLLDLLSADGAPAVIEEHM